MSDTNAFSLKKMCIQAIGVTVLFVGIGFYLHHLVHSNDRAAFVLGCTWDGKITKSICEQQATLKGY